VKDKIADKEYTKHQRQLSVEKAKRLKDYETLSLKKKGLYVRFNIRKRTTRYSFDSDESEFELPKNEKHARAVIKNSDYLKLYQNKNPMHDGDREKSSSLVKNLVYPG